MFACENKNKLTQLSVVLFVTMIELFASSAAIYLITFTFGAYLFEYVFETILFSVFMSSMCIMPLLLACKHQSPLALLDRVLLKNEFESVLEKTLANLAYGAMVGAWLGALVIPLDWDRWWQEWPVSCMMGATCGSVVGVLADRIKLKFKGKLHI
jgi:phosphatidylinositol glycan class F